MSDQSHGPLPWNQPPPAPPLPPSRVSGVFQRFIAPLSFNSGTRPQGTQPVQGPNVSLNPTTSRGSRDLPSQTTAHRTGIPVAAFDTNKTKTHAILAGHEILKTVHVHNGRMVEDFNLRSSIHSYASAHAARSEIASHRREYLPAKDVVWSKGGRYDTIIATAALNGRIALYDVSRLNRSRIEMAWIHEHTGQVNKLDFDPTGGYLLLSGSQDKTVRIWDIREPQSVKRKQTINIRQPVRDVRWSPSEVGEFALCTENGVIQRWDLRQPQSALLSINAHEKACYAIDWHPDGRHLVSGGFDKYAKVWDFKSDNRRQKPSFSLRAPQAILNIRWRPPCQSSDLNEKAQLQSTQLATSYTDDDPRIHIWDLRRPLLPFREHDKYNIRPTGLLWASENYLWSVGNLGMFTQTDIRDTTLVHDDIPVSTTGFMPDGSFVAFSEDTRSRRKSLADDPAAGFLSIPREKLSGGTDGAISRSFSDDDEGQESIHATSLRRRISRSSRSAKSQGNTPPSGDNLPNILPLDRAVLSRTGLFNNEQSGSLSSIIGLAAEPEVVDFLADNYARPLALEEGNYEAPQILDQLHDAFVRNADACDYVSMHRMAQSWRILGAVVLRELQDWADSNRKIRVEAEIRRKASPYATRSTKVVDEPTNVMPAKTKIMNNLFKGVTESEWNVSEVESTSNMTTPIAKPLPDSPSVSQHRHGNNFLSLNEVIEPIPPLPPSVVSAHSTAAAAARALFDATSEYSPSSSPEKLRQPPLLSSHKRSITDIPLLSTDRKAMQGYSPKSQPIPKQVSSPLVPASPRMELRKQEDRRAAIRDFRGSQRPLFTFGDSIQSPRFNTGDRHDSSESFPMFSASTDSSHRARSLGQSLDLSQSRIRGYRDSEDWHSVRLEDAIESLPSGSSDSLREQNHTARAKFFEDDGMQEDFPMDESSRHDFISSAGDNTKHELVRPKASAAASMWDIGELRPSGSVSQSDTAASSASESVVFPLEEVSNTKELRIYTTNPIRRLVARTPNNLVETPERQNSTVVVDEVSSKEYTSDDFRPIDMTVYEPKLPFAWSSLPLICHSIAFDMSEGIANAQFSVHLLMHLYPFFFKPPKRMRVQPGVVAPDSIAERLMRPDLSPRIIESLFLSHYLYLKKMGMFKPMAELRKTCTVFGFRDVFDPHESDQPIGASLQQDPFLLQQSCIHCYTFMQPGTIVCQNCARPRAGCPICLQFYTTNQEQNFSEQSRPQKSHLLWTFCQACGHGAHWNCMQEWMSQPDAEGECPTRGCECGCGEGQLRQERIARQHVEAETTEMIRGGRTPTIPKKDPARASHSPAVDKTRDNLRHSEMTRDSSGDEHMRRSFSGRGGMRGGMSGSGGVSRGASQSLGRRVRLVTPGEESATSYSVS